MSGSETIHLFSYGTLQQNDVQMSTFGRLLAGKSDTMPGYEQAMVEITDPEVIQKSGRRFHPIVRESPDPTARVEGQVFEITGAELAAADAYEVSDYKRVLVRLTSGIAAWVYVKA
jgi:gamma-glutamylcyclotransferase (GGCT)/AIG2-like uncharacterized protein YtfP